MWIGIDLGTTNSVMAYMDAGEARIIPNDRGHHLTPSVVSFDDRAQALVGEVARNRSVSHAQATISHMKALIGQKRLIRVGSKRYSPEELSALVLGKLRRDAERYLGQDVREAVITVPAHFNQTQRRATRDAAALAGFREIRLLSEPTAAALAYARRHESGRHILVYDLGGGTFDVTCLVREGRSYQVRSTRGDGSLGGRVFDQAVQRRVRAAFRKESGLDLASDPAVFQQLIDQCERAKIELSNSESTVVALPFVSGAGKPLHLSYELTRDELTDLIGEHIDHSVELTMSAVQEAGFGLGALDSLVLSGGSSRIPLVRERLRKALGLEQVALVNPDEVVALGAAIYAEEGGAEVLLEDVSGYSIGVEVAGGRMVPIIQRNRPLPAEESRVFTTVADGQSSVEIHVMQGESEDAAGNQTLGRFILTGIREAPAGESRIRVRFRADSEGMVEISARDADSGAHTGIFVSLRDAADNEAMSFGSELDGLIDRAVELQAALGSADRELFEEASVIVEVARQHAHSGDQELMREARIALEALVGELLLHVQTQEARNAGA